MQGLIAAALAQVDALAVAGLLEHHLAEVDGGAGRSTARRSGRGAGRHRHGRGGGERGRGPDLLTAEMGQERAEATAVACPTAAKRQPPFTYS